MFDINEINGDAAHLDLIAESAMGSGYPVMAIGRQTNNVYAYRGTFIVEHHDGYTVARDIDATMAATIAYTLDHA